MRDFQSKFIIKVDPKALVIKKRYASEDREVDLQQCPPLEFWILCHNSTVGLMRNLEYCGVIEYFILHLIRG